MSTTPQLPTSAPSTRSRRSRRSGKSRKPKQHDVIPLLDQPLSYRVAVADERDRINGAFRSGFLEGQKHLMLELARLVETYLTKHDYMSHRGDVEACRQKIGIHFSYYRDQSDTHQMRS